MQRLQLINQMTKNTRLLTVSIWLRFTQNKANAFHTALKVEQMNGNLLKWNP